MFSDRLVLQKLSIIDKLAIAYLLYYEGHMNIKSRNLSAAERKELTIETVVELAAEQNPAEITTTAIAQRMGLTQGALFRHFSSKEVLLEATMQWTCQRLLEQVDEAAATAGCPSSALEAMFLAHTDYVARYPGVPRLLYGELQRPGKTPVKTVVESLLKKYSQRLQQHLQQGIERGDFYPQLNTQAAASLYIGSIQALVIQATVSGEAQLISQQAPAAFALFRRSLEIHS